MHTAQDSWNWQRIASAVTIRRAQLGIRRQEAAAERAGIGVTTWRQIEGNKQIGYSPAILAAVERGLDWPSGAIEQIGTGGDIPQDAPGDIRSRLADVEDEVIGLQAEVRALRGAVDLLLTTIAPPSATQAPLRAARRTGQQARPPADTSPVRRAPSTFDPDTSADG